MATAEGNSVAAANDRFIDGLLQGSQWSFGTGPHVLTYSFNISGVPGAGNWTAAQEAGVRAAFAAWSAVANIQFKEVKSGTYFYQSTADIALSLTGNLQQQDGFDGEGEFPDATLASQTASDILNYYAPGAGPVNYANPQGDIFLDNKALPGYLNPFGYFNAGGASISTILHEIGHALGLKHPFDDGGNGDPTFSQLGIGSLDTNYNTVMSYTKDGQPYYDATDQYFWVDWGNPSTPMPLDILTIQYLYGVNRTTNTGNNTYYFRDNGVVQTIWDAGGYDTLDASGLPAQSLDGYNTIDLRPGQISRYTETWVDPYGRKSTSAIAMSYTPTETQDGPVGPIDNLIERAIGSAGIDHIFGNNADNTLLGGAGDDVIQDTVGNDYIDGGTGADQMSGGAGNDTYIVDNWYDSVIENANEGTDTVIASVQVKDFANVENYTYTGKLSWSIATDASDNIVIGGSGADFIYTNAGNDTLNGGAGADTLTGGTGDDTYVIDNVGDKVIENAGEGNDTVKSSILLTSLIANVENYTYTGALAWTFAGDDGDNALTGGSGKDVLTGGLGNDTLSGGAGADKLIGGQGNDTYVVDNVGDVVIEAAGEGTDLIKSSVSINLAAGAFIGQEIENVTLTGAATINVTGNAIANILTGNDGANIIDGGAGADAMAGGLGNDTYIIDNAGDTVTEDANAGIDTVKSSILLTATIANIENYTYTGASDWTFTGTDDANAITGGSGNDKLDGGAGADTLTGGLGNDTYIVDNTGDKVIEALNQGIDTIVLATDYANDAFSYVLSANVENFDASQVAAVVAVTASGNALTNVITGGTGNDTLDGGAGADTLSGGTGDDTYIIDNIGDKVIENADEGNDTVKSSILLTSLIANVENYTYTGALAWTFTGDDGDNALTGGSGKDVLTGGLGNDTLSGGAGADKLIGGQGNDTYIIDNVGDVVVEAAGQGTDLIKSSVSINLAAGAFIGQEIENVTLTGAAAINVTGNAIGNILYGNDGANIIDGGTGADKMAGGLGNDTYIIDNAGDRVIENANEGTDTVRTSVAIATAIDNVENYTYTGTGDWSFAGNTLANVITAGSGNDKLDGGAGADTLAGGIGNDTYIVDNTGDKVIEALNQGIDTVILASTYNGSSYVLAANLENLDASQLTAAVAATGNALGNAIAGGSGNDTLDGGAGADTLTGGLGNDIYYVDNVGDKVIENANEGIDTVRSSILLTSTIANVENYTYLGAVAWTFAGDDANNAITGGGGKDTLSGGLGNDTLSGGAGADKLIGGQGNDTYIIDNVGDVVVEAAGQGTDLIKSSVSINLAAGAFIGQEIENVTLTGAAAINVTGNAIANILTGNDGANIIDGGAGADTMAGGQGNDTYVIDNAGDTVIENANEGTDTVKTSVAITTAIANVENYTYTGASDWAFTGTDGANVITGGSGNDKLDGAAGADTLAGGIGNDTYIVDNIGDKVIEALNQGIDTVILASNYNSTSYVLGANLENLDASQITGAVTLTGNALNNAITGGSGNDTLNGGAGVDILTGGQGDDTYIIDNAGDVVVEAADQGNDTVRSSILLTSTIANVENYTYTGALAWTFTGDDGDNALTGGSGKDTLSGGLGNDTLDGGAGADRLIGGQGDDTYIIDNVGDVVVEVAGEGTDLIKSSVSINLAAGAFIGQDIENVTLTSAAAINVTGNALDNILTGNAAANVLVGGDGNDFLDGGAGADTMSGGQGNDTYVIDNVGDKVTELANQGTDTVLASISINLAGGSFAGQEIENVTLTGSAAINATGNALNNILTGNDAANILDGGAGADTMIGGKGDDTYIVDNVGDVVTEDTDGGTDTIKTSITYFQAVANVENYIWTGNGSFVFTGNDDDNQVTGGALNDQLDGGSGADTLIGGLGDDTYTVDNLGDRVIEDVGGGTDTVKTSIAITTPFANVENYVYTGTADWTFSAGAENNNIIGGSGRDTLSGGDGNDVLQGGAGDDILDGGSGQDMLYGGAGNDTYIVHGFYDGRPLYAGDGIFESAAGGTDTVILASDFFYLAGFGPYILADNVENLDSSRLKNSVSLLGNAADNVVTAGNGDDTLDGGAGADTLIGGQGNDTYIIDNVGDTIVEESNGGTDTVKTSALISTAFANVENYTYMGSGNWTFTGNDLNNVITGGSGNDTLYGGAGDDTLIGGLGADYLDGGSGNNTADYRSSIFGVNISLAANAANTGGDVLVNIQNLIGTSSDDTLTGDAGNNVLNGLGSSSQDTLTGGGGYDTYIFDLSYGATHLVIDNAVAGGSAPSGELDIMGTALTAQKVWLSQSGQDLLIRSLAGFINNPTITIKNWFGSNASARLSEIVLGDGSKIDTGVSALVNAMASYAVAHPGFNPNSTYQMPTDQTLQNAITTAWHH